MNHFDLAAAFTNPAVAPVMIFLAVLGLHVLVGAALHAFRLHDFDWHEVGNFVEKDYAVVRGIAIGTTFIITLATTMMPGADWRVAFVPAWLALVGACGSSVLSILRDTLYDAVQLLTGSRPMSAPKHRGI